MLIFLLVFLTLYGGLNTYVYYTVFCGLGYHSWPLAGVLVLLVFSPIALRISEGRIPAKVSKLIAWVGYNWMGVSFLFVSFALLTDIAQLFFDNLTQRNALYLVTGMTAIVSVYGFFESRRIRIRRLTVQSPKLGYQAANPFRIVQISDVHLGYGTLPGQVESMVKIIEALSPDLLVSTGDLFDTDLENLNPQVEQLRKLSPPQGKIGISGNHEVYAGLEKALELTRASGFRVLRSEAMQVASDLYLAGVDDPEAMNGKAYHQAEEQALRGIPKHAFTILLKHRPHVSISLCDHFDLQLSGHTHGGQIFPFIFLTRLQYRARHGLSRIAGTTYLYLSRGTGTWGPQMRVFAPPEISVFDLCQGGEFKIVLTG